MSIDHMILLIENWAADSNMEPDGEAIIAALKAGQAMRDEYFTSTVSTGDNPWFDKAVDAWDAATTEIKR
jgi:hypothetical protein